MKMQGIKIWGFMSFLPSLALAQTESVQPNIRTEVERLLHRGNAVMNAYALDSMGLSTAKTETQPWTSSYWPDAIGGIAARYQKTLPILSRLGIVFNFDFNKSHWSKNNEKMKKKVLKMSEEEIARNLSPAEKYDLLMGDLNFTLTNNIIGDIQYRYHHKPSPTTGLWVAQKGMAAWVGICDGWTTASLHTPRPSRTIRVLGGTGQIVTFYPDDIKALAAHLFARTNQWLNIERVGNRCRDRKPKVGEDGQALKEECGDINAGLWHATVMNRIGIDRRGFVIDVDNNTAVNNHPVFGYQVRYFNPETKVYGPLDMSVVKAKNNPNPLVSKVVGVEMTVNMLNYAMPTGKETDSEEDDKDQKTALYVYDLELDEQGEIIGGTFYNHNEPDMLWMLAPKQLAWSRSSMEADEGPAINPNHFEIWNNIDWNFKGDGRIPLDWYNASLKSAVFKYPRAEPWAMIDSAAPLAEMVYYLMDRAKN
jgi:hypothetical protein